MKVILRLNKGIETKKVEIPDNKLDRFVLPVTMLIIRPEMRILEKYNAVPNIPKLIFSWDGKSKWSGTLPILDLVSIENN